MSGVGPLPCSKPRPETGTSDLGGGGRALAAEQREGSDPEGAAGEACATHKLFPLVRSCQTFHFAIYVPLAPALIDTL